MKIVLVILITLFTVTAFAQHLSVYKCKQSYSESELLPSRALYRVTINGNNGKYVTATAGTKKFSAVDGFVQNEAQDFFIADEFKGISVFLSQDLQSGANEGEFTAVILPVDDSPYRHVFQCTKVE